MGQFEPAYIPTEDEIRERAEEIREKWTPAIERKRRTGSTAKVPYEFPRLPLTCLVPSQRQSDGTI